MLGPSVTLTGLPLGCLYSARAVRRAPDRTYAMAALAVSAVALAGLALVIARNVLSR